MLTLADTSRKRTIVGKTGRDVVKTMTASNIVRFVRLAKREWNVRAGNKISTNL